MAAIAFGATAVIFAFGLTSSLSRAAASQRHTATIPVRVEQFGRGDGPQQLPSAALFPYKGYTNITQYRSDSTSNYHALQAYAARSMGRVTFTVSYTFSKALGDSSGSKRLLELLGIEPPIRVEGRSQGREDAGENHQHILFQAGIRQIPFYLGGELVLIPQLLSRL